MTAAQQQWRGGEEAHRMGIPATATTVVAPETLAIEGGTPVRQPRINPAGERFGEEELQLLEEVIRSQRLNVNSGTKVHEFERRWAAYLGVKHAVMVTSGTAAIHVALGALKLEPGSEIITAPITDFGTIAPILQQLCVPVFADLDPTTLCLDPLDVERRITPRTRAIVAVHLAGNACDMGALLDVARRHDLALVEDCAQSYNAQYEGQKVGTFGRLACFSLNQAKHISCGDGGIVVTNNDELAARAVLFADKAWPRDPHDPNRREHLFVAPNYRVTELQAAVALAQLGKLDSICARRTARGDQLTALIDGTPGVETVRPCAGGVSTYWFHAFRVPAAVRDAFARALQAEGVPCSAGYIPKPIYLFDVLRDKQTFGTSHFPFGHAPFRPAEGAGEIEYREGLCPVTEREVIPRLIRVPLNEFWTEADVRDAAHAVRKVAAHFARQP
jgi:dTDP-4-amino-4,6-dideoxygalactose transaminase